jgi:hypothetical protein
VIESELSGSPLSIIVYVVIVRYDPTVSSSKSEDASVGEIFQYKDISVRPEVLNELHNAITLYDRV